MSTTRADTILLSSHPLNIRCFASRKITTKKVTHKPRVAHVRPLDVERDNHFAYVFLHGLDAATSQPGYNPQQYIASTQLIFTWVKTDSDSGAKFLV